MSLYEQTLAIKLIDYQRGIRIHQQLSSKSLEDPFLLTSLIHFFTYQIFSTVERENLFTYGAMLKGYLSNNMPEKVIELYEKISIKVDEVITTLLFNACAKLSNEYSIRIGNHVLNRLPKSFLQYRNLLHLTIDMLMKFGQVEDAEDFFRQVKTFDSTIYGIIMNGYKINNQPFECLSIFEEVKKKNVEINIPMALALIGACGQLGMRSTSKKIIQYISHLQNNHSVKVTWIDMWPELFINAYARNGMGYEAIKIFEQMPENIHDSTTYICVLNACSHSGLVDQARNIFKKIPRKTDSIVTAMRFKAHDRSHPRSKEIYDELERISKELKEHGYEYDSSWITRPIQDGESVESILCGHSEKLAIAFNFIQQPRPSFIQITKNLRVCGDCHRATKMIAKIRQCEIVVRDANRLHHFYTNGQCSCQDHF
ncbi:hypothetical protein I4U23_021692 [Adineta vaga]|nr:hypothetical protein I4U23_021692 [Adineta vaga]